MAVQLHRKPLSASLPPRWWSPLLFLAVLAVYVRTLNPSLFRNDSPETITACFTLGVSHPPGYPLHTLLGHLFSWLPLGNPAMVINFFAASLGALGAVLFATNVWMFLEKFTLRSGQKPPALGISVACIIGSLCFAFSKSYWSASLAAKGGIYNFQVVLELGFLLGLQFWIQKMESQKKTDFPKYSYFLFFLFSLGLANHWATQTLLLPALALGAYVYSKTDSSYLFQTFRIKHFLIDFALMVIVGSLYLYLPLRAHLNPTLNFGHPSNFQRLCASLFRANYFKVETLASFLPTALSTIQDKGLYISDRFGTEFSVLFSLLAFLGIFAFWRYRFKSELLFLLLLLLTTVAANLVYLQVIPIEYWHMDDHLLTINWVTALLASVGVYLLFTWAQPRRSFRYVAAVLLIVLPIFTFQKNISADNQTKEFLYRGYGMEALKSMDQNARYFAESDYDYFSILYLKEVELKRSDVTLKMTTFLAKNDWDNLIRNVSLSSFLANRPIYCAFPNGDFINGYLRYAKIAALQPTGTVIEFIPPWAVLQKKPDLDPLEDLWDHYLAPGRRSANPIDSLLEELCAHPYLNMAQFLRSKKDYSKWDVYPEIASTLIQDNHWLGDMWAEKGAIDRKMGRLKEALGDYGFALVGYQEAGDSRKYNTAFQIWSTLKRDWELKTKNPTSLSKGRVR